MYIIYIVTDDLQNRSNFFLKVHYTIYTLNIMYIDYNLVFYKEVL